MTIEYDIIPGENNPDKSCAWYYIIDKEHYLDIYRDKNYTFGKDYTDKYFVEENKIIVNSIKYSKAIQDKLSKSDKKLFFIKLLCKSCNQNKFITRRKRLFESDPDKAGKFEFILLQ